MHLPCHGCYHLRAGTVGIYSLPVLSLGRQHLAAWLSPNQILTKRPNFFAAYKRHASNTKTQISKKIHHVNRRNDRPRRLP